MNSASIVTILFGKWVPLLVYNVCVACPSLFTFPPSVISRVDLCDIGIFLDGFIEILEHTKTH